MTVFSNFCAGDRNRSRPGSAEALVPFFSPSLEFPSVRGRRRRRRRRRQTSLFPFGADCSSIVSSSPVVGATTTKLGQQNRAVPKKEEGAVPFRFDDSAHSPTRFSSRCTRRRKSSCRHTEVQYSFRR